jgi:hypothetical protein
MINPYFVKFPKIWKNILFLLASKVDWVIKIKVKIFLGIMKSLRSKMVYYVMMNFCMYLMALFDFKLNLNVPVVGHFGFNKTMELISLDY